MTKVDIAAPARKLHIDLPNKLSALLRLALEDLNMVEQSPKYDVDMGEWHRPVVRQYGDNVPPLHTCIVCLAGAVMTRALNEEEQYDPQEFDDDTVSKFDALDFLRHGHIEAAYLMLFPATDMVEEASTIRMLHERGLRSRIITRYAHGPEQFRSQLHKLADDLEKAGL